MKPFALKTKIFLDSGDPKETKEAMELLGFLDGQTTNPSLIAKSPSAAGKKFTEQEVWDFYKGIVKEISALLPNGSISIEVSADLQTTAEQMFKQAKGFYNWIPNAYIKFPTTKGGLEAAEMAVKEGLRVNMTLVFSQEQAAAVYAATKDSANDLVLNGSFKRIFVSPFIGRLDDRGEYGMDLIKNIINMYGHGNGHVEVLTASIRSVEHMAAAIEAASDIITVPLKVLKEWVAAGMPQQITKQESEVSNLKSIPYQDISLDKPWQEYNIQHDLTDMGIQKFSEDWAKLLKI